MAERPLTLENAAALILRERNFSAELIEVADSPTPDICARDSAGQRYFLEIKDRTVSWLDRADLVAARSGAEVRIRTDPTGPSNALSAVIKKAARQLEAGTSDEGSLRLLWFFADPTDRYYHYELIRHTLYGVKVVVATREGQSATREGIYVAPAEFVRWRDSIDGALLGNFEALFLNDLSPRYHLLKGSEIAKKCGDFVFDPLAAKESDQFYYLQPDNLSPTVENVTSRLESIHGIHVAELMNLHRFSAG